ncbi:hypothetical protein TNCV_1657881 [Trichonephila clavipes]|nr:hypothetical protein TNCV_1657881 [Trichonephila clavipes]
MLRRLVGTTAPGHHDCFQFRNEKVSNHGSIPITIDCNVVAFIVFEEFKVTGIRKRGRPRLRWTDSMEPGFINEKTWRMKVNARSLWRLQRKELAH